MIQVFMGEKSAVVLLNYLFVISSECFMPLYNFVSNAKLFINLRWHRNDDFVFFLQPLKAAAWPWGLSVRCRAHSYGSGADEGEEERCDAAVVSCCHFICRPILTEISNVEWNHRGSSLGINTPEAALVPKNGSRADVGHEAWLMWCLLLAGYFCNTTTAALQDHL